METFPTAEQQRQAILLWKREVMRMNPKGLKDLNPPVNPNQSIPHAN